MDYCLRPLVEQYQALKEQHVVKTGSMVLAGLLALGLSVGLAGTAAAAPEPLVLTIPVAAGEAKTGTITCAPGRVAGVSSQATNASAINRTTGNTVQYTVRGLSNQPGQVTYTVRCTD
jgi:hypothetical protein